MPGEEFIFKFGADWQAFLTSTQAALQQVEKQLTSGGLRSDASGLIGGGRLSGVQATQLNELRQMLNLAKEINSVADKAASAPGVLATRLVNAQRVAANQAPFVNPNVSTLPGAVASQTLTQESINRIQSQLLAAQAVLRDRGTIGNLTPDQTGQSRGGQAGFNDAIAAATVETQKQTALQSAATARWQRADDEYIQAITQAALETRATAAVQKQNLNKALLNPELLPGGGPVRTLQAAEAQNAVDKPLLDAQAIQRQNAIIEALPGSTAAYVKEVADAAALQKIQNSLIKAATDARQQEFLATTEGAALIKLQAENAASQTRVQVEQQAIQDNILAKNREYLTAVSESTLAARKRAAKEQEAANAQFTAPTPNSQAAQVLNTEARNTVDTELQKAAAQVRQNAAITKLPGGFTQYAESLAQGAVAQETRNAIVKAATDTERSTNARYINSMASSSVAEEQRKVAITAATQALLREAVISDGKNTSLITQQGVNSANAAGIAAERRSAEINALITGKSQQSLDLMAARIVDEKELNAALKERTRAELQSRKETGLTLTGAPAPLSSSLAGGTLTQKIQAFIANRTGGGQNGVALPADFQEFGQFLSSKALTTAGFAVSGVAFYGLFQGIQQAFSEANKLEVQFSLLKEELVQTDRAGEFPTLKKGILDISKETGVMADEVANVALQLQGAFANKGAPYVLDQTKAAAQLSRVTNEPIADLTNQGTAISKTFDVSFRDIGDTVIGLQQKFGVLAKEIIQFSGDLAPVAAQAGLSFKDLASIGTVVEQLSGRSGPGLSEGLGRVLSGLQNNALKVLDAYQSNPKLSKFTDEIAKDFSKGDTGAVLKRLIVDFQGLSKAQQNLLASALGGSRQAPILNALFGGSKEIRDAIQGTTTDAGKLDSQFKQMQTTLTQTLAQLKQGFLQFGIVLLNLGVVQFLKGVANAANDLLSIISPLVGGVRELGKAFDAIGVGGHLTELVALVAAVAFVRGFKNETQGGITGGKSAVGNLFGDVGGFFGVGPKSAAAKEVAAAATIRPPIASESTTSSGLILPGAIPVTGGAATVAQAEQASLLRRVLTSSGAQLGAGVALGIGGQAIGGLGGNILSSIGTGLSVGAFNAPAGLVVAGAGILSSFFSAAEDAKANSDQLHQQYADLATTGKGQTELFKIATSQKNRGFDDSAGTVFSRGLSTIGNFFTGGENKDQIALDEIQKQGIKDYVGRFQAVKDQIGNKNKDLTNQINKVISAAQGLDSADQTDTGYNLIANAYNTLGGKVNQGIIKGINLAKAFKQGAKKVDDKKFIDELNKATVDDSTDTIAQLTSLYNTGGITLGDYVSKLQHYRQLASKLVADNASPQALQEYIQATDAVNKVLDQGILSNLKSLQTAEQYSGKSRAGLNVQAALAPYVAALAAPGTPGALGAPADRAAALQQGIQEAQRIQQAKINLAQSPDAKFQATVATTPLPKRLQTEFVAEQVGPLLSSNQALYDDALKGLGSDTKVQTLINKASDDIIATGDVPAKALIKAANAMEANLKKQLAHIKGNSKKADKSRKDLETRIKALDAFSKGAASDPNLQPGASTLDSVGTDPTAAYVALVQQNEQIHEAQINLLKARSAGNPIASANYDILLAQAQGSYAASIGDKVGVLNAAIAAVNASNAKQQAIENLELAKLNYAKALVSGDPIASAQADLAIIDEQAAYAAKIGDQAGQWAAAANKVLAERALQQAIYDNLNAQTEFAIAVATAGGDSVRAAQLQLAEAQNKVSQAIAQGTKGANLQTLQNDVITKQAALRDAGLQNAEATIQFNLDAKNISQEQALVQYEALLNQADILKLTEAEKRDLILKIVNLKNSLGQDFQFNLPTQLQLPTLYEVRRLNQAGGSSNVDNRQIVINLNANGASTAQMQDALNQVTAAVNTSPVFGSVPRRY